ncbi:MAG: winged helix-turn-helix domain-containing protein, partial [Terriglobales bacterium]
MSIYRFGPFEVRTRVRELYRSGTKVRLRGQPFQLLEALLNHPGEIVTREQMRAELWPS